MERAEEKARSSYLHPILSSELNCGGSDSFRGITANPALGYCCDCRGEMGRGWCSPRQRRFSELSIYLQRARNGKRLGNCSSCVEKYKTVPEPVRRQL